MVTYNLIPILLPVRLKLSIICNLKSDLALLVQVAYNYQVVIYQTMLQILKKKPSQQMKIN